jgi:hypothetical protein
MSGGGADVHSEFGAQANQRTEAASRPLCEVNHQDRDHGLPPQDARRPTVEGGDGASAFKKKVRNSGATLLY